MTSFVLFGGAEGDRTPDPKTASLVLSQLSYSPTIPSNEVLNVTSRYACCQEKRRFWLMNRAGNAGIIGPYEHLGKELDVPVVGAF